MPKCPKECGKCNPFIFRKTVIPAQVADDTVTPPKIGAYCNALVVYEATGNAYLFSSDGIPTLLSATDYELLANLPSINGVTVVGDLTLEDLGIAQLVEAEAETRAGADTYLQEQIDAITLSSDVVDIVGTYQELEDYDTSHLSENDIIKVLADETVGGATTYYRWVNNSWEYIGEEGPYYTKSQTDALLDEKLDTDALDDYYDKDEVDDLLDDKADVSALADKQDKLIAGSNITIDQATNVISATVPSLDNYYTKSETYSQNEVDGLISGVESQIPTSTSQLINDSGFLTSIPIASANDLGGIKVGSGLSIDADGVLSATAPSITVDSSLSTTSTNPVQNQVITNALNGKADISDIPVVPSNISAFYNDVGYVTSATIAQNYYNKSETYTQNEVDGLISGVEAQIPTKTSDLSNDGSDGTSTYVEADELATVATSGSYNDLLNKPTIYDPEDYYWANVKVSDTSATDTTPTFKRATFSGSAHPHIAASGTLTFSADGNWSAGNHGNMVLNTYSLRPSSNQSGALDLGAAANTGIWRNLYLSGGIYHGTYLLTLPDKAGTVALLSDLPTVNNATLTIQENGSTVGTFTANASSNVTANITVPTKTSDLTNDSGFITASDEQQCEDGASISIDNPNSSPVPLSSVELLGNTAQDTLSGKNLVGFPEMSGSIDGVTYSVASDGTITYNGTSTRASGTSQLPEITGYKNLTAGNITMSIIPISGTFSAGTIGYRTLPTSGTTQIYYQQRAYTNVASAATINLTEEQASNIVRHNLFINAGSSFTNYKFKLQVTAGTTYDSNYEEYCGGIASPNPDFPQTVQTTTGEQVVKMMGKNVYNATTAQTTSQGLTYSGDTGYIYLNGTRTGNGGINWANGYLPAGKYKLMLELVSGSITSTASWPTGQLFFVYGANITLSPSQIALSSNYPKGSITLTVSADTTNAHINSWARTTETCTNAVIKYQIVRGEDDDYDFEPYQSQSYEVDLTANLFNSSENTTDYYINSSGAEAANANWDISDYIPVVAGKTYSYQGLTQVGNAPYSAFYNASKTFVSSFKQAVGNNTITIPSGVAYVRFSIYHSAQYDDDDNQTFKFWDTPNAIELCKLGTYQDKIYKSGDDWYIHKAVGKAILDGSISPDATNTSSTNTARFLWSGLLSPVASCPSADRLNSKCDHFVVGNNWGRDDVGIYFDEGQTGNTWFRVNKSIATTSAGITTWLTNNPVTLYYTLGTTAYDTQITNEDLIDQLNALKAASLYAGENNIMLIPAGGAQGTLDLCFYSSTLPVATSGSLGAVAVGDGLSITDAGVLSVDPPVPTKTSELLNDGEDGTAEYLEDDETAYQTASIPYGQCDNTSTSTVFTATVSGITELRDGVCMWLKNGVVTSAAGFTININGLGAKPVYQNMAAASAETTLFNVNYTMFFVYDSTRVAGGCWVLYRGYNANDDYRAYQVRTNSSTLPMKSVTYRYRLLFTSGDGKNFVPATNSSSTNATDSRTVCQDKINPFGSIFYYSSTAQINANSRPGASNLWQQYAMALGYSFNRTGAALTLTQWKPVYVKAAPQADGSAIIDSTTPYVQDLPTTDDGKIYIFLGVAYSATNIELLYNHPVYYYKDGMIRPYTNTAVDSALSTSSENPVQNKVITGALDGKTNKATFYNNTGSTTYKKVTIVGGTDSSDGVGALIFGRDQVYTLNGMSNSGYMGVLYEIGTDVNNSAININNRHLHLKVVGTTSTTTTTIYVAMDAYCYCNIHSAGTITVADSDSTEYEGATANVAYYSIPRSGSASDKVKYTSYNIAPTADTTAAWKTALGGDGTYFTWYNTANRFTNQPVQYGFLRTIIGVNDIRQDWWTQTGGNHYFRAGNGTGWYGSASDAGAFRNITVNNGTLTIQKNGTNVQTFTANQSSNVTANITVPTNLSDLYNDMGFASYSAGDHISISNNVISAVDYVHSENPVTVTGSTPTVTSGMIADGAITASKLAAGVNLTLVLSTTDIGEGAALAANTLYGVYQ